MALDGAELGGWGSGIDGGRTMSTGRLADGDDRRDGWPGSGEDSFCADAKWKNFLPRQDKARPPGIGPAQGGCIIVVYCLYIGLIVF